MKNAVPKSIVELVERFRDHAEAYHAGRYNETQIRREFIDPLFTALGWDVDNSQGHAEAYKDVIHEDAIKIGGATKAPDYCFRIGGVRKFFVEAKKPSVNIKGDAGPAFQLRRYAWSAKLPLSILTDFEELAVYDCRVRPVKTDKSDKTRTKYFRYDEFPQRWDELADIFSKEAILKGSFDKYADSAKRKRGTSEVDDAFLAEIEQWREMLARNIALRNGLSQRDLNFSVQRTIDRIVFLRICEDRGIETYGTLQALMNGSEVYKRLFERFRRADERYNSGLFHFEKEKDRPEAPDDLTPSLKIDDKPIKDILRRLYYPESPYEFSVLPADILGQVYEQFLGKVIRLTSGHQAKVEEKPEVRKAGGVYYTPTYIVDYIVKHTVGKLVEGKTPRQVGALTDAYQPSKAKNVRPLTILDPACGSGSFLLGAYQFLLDWYRDAYLQDGPEKHTKGKTPRLYQHTSGEWRLTTTERKRILLSHIYGVDIDSQAVETTKLSLLLKVLEGETGETIGSNLKLFHQRALPDLASNIKCGNSLIGPDFYDGRQMNLFDEEERLKINVFDWNTEFKPIMDSGGFDTVIGNPPYIQQSMADYYDDQISDYCISLYSSSMGRLNTFGLFIERSLKILLKNDGYDSFIVPNTLLTQEGYQGLRLMVLDNQILNLTSYKYPVFKDAVVETVVFVVKRSKPKQGNIDVILCDNHTMVYESKQISQKLYFETHKNAFLVTANTKDIEIRGKIDKVELKLGNLANINQAIALAHDRSKSLFQQKKGKNYKPVLDGRHIGRYQLKWGGDYLAYDVTKIHSCKRTDIFEAKEKIFFRRVGDRLIATCDNEKYYALNTLVVITFKSQNTLSIKYLLGLINSKLLNYYYVHFLKSTKKVFSEIQARQLAQLPIQIVNFSDPIEKAKHDRMVSLVQTMLDLHKELDKAKTGHGQTAIQRQIDATDRQIDQLVYELYGLTEDEIRIVEEATK